MIPPDQLKRLRTLLSHRRVISANDLQYELGVSRATLTRYLRDLRDAFGVPVVSDREGGGYRLENDGQHFGSQFELPGLWFTAQEIHALLTMQYLLSNLDSSGLLGPHIGPLLTRLQSILGAADDSASEVSRRIRIQTVGARRFRLEHFQSVASGTLRRRRLMIEYHARGTDSVSRREISPQRLIHYRDNWYLDGWCHLRNELRSFAIDAISRVELLDTLASDIEDALLDRVLGSGSNGPKSASAPNEAGGCHRRNGTLTKRGELCPTDATNFASLTTRNPNCSWTYFATVAIAR